MRDLANANIYQVLGYVVHDGGTTTCRKYIHQEHCSSSADMTVGELRLQKKNVIRSQYLEISKTYHRWYVYRLFEHIFLPKYSYIPLRGKKQEGVKPLDQECSVTNIPTITQQTTYRTPPPFQPSSMRATGPGSTSTPTGTTRGRLGVAAARTDVYPQTRGTTISGQTLAGRAKGAFSTALMRTMDAASPTPSRSPKTLLGCASPSTRGMKTRGP